MQVSITFYSNAYDCMALYDFEATRSLSGTELIRALKCSNLMNVTGKTLRSFSNNDRDLRDIRYVLFLASILHGSAPCRPPQNVCYVSGIRLGYMIFYYELPRLP